LEYFYLTNIAEYPLERIRNSTILCRKFDRSQQVNTKYAKKHILPYMSQMGVKFSLSTKPNESLMKVGYNSAQNSN